MGFASILSFDRVCFPCWVFPCPTLWIHYRAFSHGLKFSYKQIVSQRLSRSSDFTTDKEQHALALFRENTFSFSNTSLVKMQERTNMSRRFVSGFPPAATLPFARWRERLWEQPSPFHFWCRSVSWRNTKLEKEADKEQNADGISSRLWNVGCNGHWQNVSCDLSDVKD